MAARNPGGTLGLFGPARELTETAWLVAGIFDNRRYELRAERSLGLLERYLSPSLEHTPEWRSFFRGAYGAPSWQPWARLAWHESDGGTGPESASASGSSSFSSLAGFELSLKAPAAAGPLEGADLGALVDWALAQPVPEPEPLAIALRKPCPRWKAPRKVTVIRYDGGESEHLALVDCEGAIAPEALDALAVLARPPGTPRPELPLPLEPEHGVEPGEWLPRVRMLHTRMVWVIAQVAEAFPGRSIHLVSGYRRDGHSGLHQKGRALDISVSGVPNEQLFALCKSLRDMGCGFYPNNKFVHIDIRPFGTQRVLWVDVSAPGTPSEYVDGWEGLVSPGTAWLPR